MLAGDDAEDQHEAGDGEVVQGRPASPPTSEHQRRDGYPERREYAHVARALRVEGRERGTDDDGAGEPDVHHALERAREQHRREEEPESEDGVRRTRQER